MSDEAKQIVIAPRHWQDPALPEDWQDQIRDIEGVEVVGSASGRMQVQAPPRALDVARRALGHVLHFEESLRRSIPDGAAELVERLRQRRSD